MTSLKIEKTQETTMVVADLDGTLLHDGETFEERFLTQRSIDVINRMHDNGVWKRHVRSAQAFRSWKNCRLMPLPISMEH